MIRKMVIKYLESRGLVACRKVNFGNNGNFVRYVEVKL